MGVFSSTAEYDNYRKRTAKEKESIYQDARLDTVEKFLEVYDNLSCSRFIFLLRGQLIAFPKHFCQTLGKITEPCGYGGIVHPGGSHHADPGRLWTGAPETRCSPPDRPSCSSSRNSRTPGGPMS